MLVMDGAADEYSQGKHLFEALSCPKEYMFFEAGDPALQHCQVGAQASLSARLFDWLNENLWQQVGRLVLRPRSRFSFSPELRETIIPKSFSF